MIDERVIRRILPHRFSALLVDRVEEFVLHERLVALKAVTVSESCYRTVPDNAPPHAYHYPVPLLLESFAQAAGLLLGLSAEKGTRGGLEGTVMLGALRDCIMEAPVLPGDVVRHEVRIGHISKGAGFVSGAITVGNRRIATVGKLFVVVQPPTSTETRRSLVNT